MEMLADLRQRAHPWLVAVGLGSPNEIWMHVS